MRQRSVLCALLCIALFGCGEKAKEMKDAMEAAKNLSENADQMTKKIDEVQQRREARKAKGDTLAIPYKDLQQYLPASINGFTAEEPSGESVNMGGMSYSSAKRNYKGANDAEVEVNILDYNQNPGMYEGITALWAMGMSVDNDREFSKTYDPQLAYSAAFEHYYKQDKRSELTIAVGGRFIVTLKAEKQANNDFLKSVASGMRLSDLAGK